MGSVLKALAHGTLKAAAAAADTVRRPDPGLVVLAYHRVGRQVPLEIDLDRSLFREQMSLLAERSDVTDLDVGLERLNHRPSEPSVVVTFDDGTADFVEYALPVLVETGVAVTYYVATRFIEEQSPFPDQGRPLTWSALSEAVSTGLVSVGSHTHNHAVMDKLPPAIADEEIRRSSELIEDRLGVSSRHFAYPKGVFGGLANEKVVARYCTTAALAVCGVNRPGHTNPLRLRRSPIQQSDRMTFFEKKVAGGMALEGALRGSLNRVRYARRAR